MLAIRLEIRGNADILRTWSCEREGDIVGRTKKRFREGKWGGEALVWEPDAFRSKGAFVFAESKFKQLEKR